MEGDKTILCRNCNAQINKNITSDNNTFIYFENGDQYTITIAEGFYEIRSLYQEIQRLMKDNGHEDAIEIIPNLNTSHCMLKIKANFAVQFGNKIKTFHKILGFREGIYSYIFGDNNYISENEMNITGM